MTRPVPSNHHTSSHIDVKHAIESYLSLHFLQRKQEARVIDSAYEALWSSVFRLFSAGGKRLRPYMTSITYQTYSNSLSYEEIMPAMAAQELLHLSMLIHDDIIDRDLIRYGVPTVTADYLQAYKKSLHDESERRHFSDSASMLAGDLLISEAYQLIQLSSVNPKKILAAQKTLGTAIFNVIGGELLDTESAFRTSSLPSPLQIAEYKTASYSFISPLVMGANLSGADDLAIRRLQAFGRCLGIGYQLRDDFLGVFGEMSVTGKSTTGDIQEGKHTYLVQLFRSLANAEQSRLFFSVFGDTRADNNDISKAKELLVHSGAKAQLETVIDEYDGHARELINGLSTVPKSRTQFHDLVTLCLKRDL